MNREFLFRGKSKETGEWVYGNLIHRETESPVQETSKTYSVDYISDYALNSTEREVDSNTIGQYTGMKDKNKKKIFDGDILKHILSDGTIVYFVVKWSIINRKLMPVKGFVYDDNAVQLNSWVFIWKKFALYPSVIDNIPDNERMEIIGNIYDNQELIEN